MGRIESSKKNILYGIFGQFFVVLLSFINRTIFIHTLGIDYLGLNGLYSSILSMLSLAELGIGSAISFSLYKPLAINDKEKIKSIIYIYKIAYKIIGIVIFVAGISLLPFLNDIVNFETTIDINYYVIYILYLLQSCVSYLFFSYSGTIISANQQEYLVSKIGYLCSFVNIFVQSLILFTTRNYYLYLVIPIFTELFRGFMVYKKATQLFPYLKEKNIVSLEKEELKVILKNVYALLTLKISGIIYSSSDNIVISTFITTTTVGIYSNYIIIINILNTFGNIVFGGLRASIGNLNVADSKEYKLDIFKKILFVNGWITPVFAICFNQLINDFIKIIWGDYVFSDFTTFLITLVFFVPNVNHTVNVFKDACGLFWQTRYRTLATALVNIISSIFLVKYIGVDGVLIGTIIAYWTTIYLKDPVIVCKEVLDCSSIFYYKWVLKTYLTSITIGMVITIILKNIQVISFGLWVLKAVICFAICNVLLVLFHYKNDEFKYFYNYVRHIFIK